MGNFGGGRANRDRMRHQPRNHNNPPSLKAPLISEIDRRPPGSRPHTGVNYHLSTFLERFKLPFLYRTPEKPPPAKQTELPITAKREEIKRAIQEHDVVGIVAPTGSGKTTMVPQFLEELGLRSWLLNPRRFATSEVASYGARQKNEELGQSVGYKHGLGGAWSTATTRMHSTEAWFYGLQIHAPIDPDIVVIRDETHERTLHGALIDADFRMRAARGEKINKRIYMSATPDIENFRREFPNAPIIEVDVRTFPVTERRRGPSMAHDAMRYATQEGPVIVFLPGKKHIKELTTELALTKTPQNPPPRILPLHSDLPYENQQAILLSYPESKIIPATNAGQSSITIPDLKVAIQSGKVRRIRLDQDGVETLTIEKISQAEKRQQEGRVGRTSPGIVINYGDPTEKLVAHAAHEITRVSLAGVALQLGAVGLTLGKINRYLGHDERISDFHANLAYRELRHLRLWGSRGITELGLKAAQLPTQPRLAKLLVRAREISHEHQVDIVGLAIDLAAVVESRGIVYKELQNLRGIAPAHGSDLLFQVNLFHKALTTDPNLLAEGGISAARVERTLNNRLSIRKKMGIAEDATLPTIGSTEAKLLLQAIIESWPDRAFQLKGVCDAGHYIYKPLAPTGDWVTVKREHTIIGGARLIVANRFNIEHEDDDGRITVEHQASFVTKISSEHFELLERIRPDEYAGHYERGISDAFRAPPKEKKFPTKRDPRFMHPQYRDRGHRRR
jgi:HrpA-like RNA helicase